MADLGPRMIQVLEFAGARAPELQALHELAHHEQVYSAADEKLSTQKNQRRRRANAFKAHRMPQRLRSTTNESNAKPQSAERCRKHERRPHKLLASRSWPSAEPESALEPPQRPVWLPSHAWHVKRMNMTPQFGLVLAAQRADKSVSAALQAVRTKATLHDASYHGVVELYGLPQLILEALQLVSDPNGSDFHGLRFLAGTEEGNSMLYHENQFPHGAIAPVAFMWRPLQADYTDDGFKLHESWQTTKRQLWLWVHPAAYMEAATALATACQAVVGEDDEGIQMLDRRGQLCRLKLRGRLADELLAGLAASGGPNATDDQEMDEEEASDHEDGFSTSRTVAASEGGNRRQLLRALRQAGRKTKADDEGDRMYSVTVSDPRLARWRDGKLRHPVAASKARCSLLQEPPTTEIPQLGTDVIASPLTGLSLSSRGKDAEEPESEKILTELASLLAWTCNNSSQVDSKDSQGTMYPSSSSALASSPEATAQDEDMTKLEPCSLLWSLSKRQTLAHHFVKDHELNERVYLRRKAGGFAAGLDGPVEHTGSQSTSLLVVRKHEQYPHTSGWDLICLPFSVPGLLKALVFGGALVVGLEEDAALATVLHQPSFPCDFPDTQAGQMYWEARAGDLEATHAKKPKAKRFSFDKHGIASPFQPQWAALFSSQSSEDDEEAESTACVLRGDEYMQPFCFYRSPKFGVSSPAAASPHPETIVPVPMPALVRVVITLPRRGNVTVNAMVLRRAPLVC
ncbi:hypothetical protein BBJ28_00001301 [Nothophytophthora sp. Chile5]|nr:hypothetical protein BBJ28_00001301 [Nothophytophthora sp. Chile5]